jgi:peptidoglycan/xylan/chitin deacetylase (PgdA/CDA1 family)
LCQRPICARCEFRSKGRLFCGPACARSDPPRNPLPRLLAASILVAAAAGAAREALRHRASTEIPLQRAPDLARPAEPPIAPASRPPKAPSGANNYPDLLEAPPEATADKPIIVSFDAGASDRGSTEILDALRQRSIRTTVFLTGEFILRFPGIARRVAEDGHEVGNHTFNHPHLTLFASGGGQRLRPGVDEDFLRDQLLRTAEIYEKTTNRKMAPIWRAPFGEENSEIRAWAARAGYSHVSWTHGTGASLDSLDWVSDEASPRYRSSSRLIDRLLASARPGGIILMHLGSERSNDPVGRQIPRLLDGLAAEGYRFATATEFLRAERVRR